MVERGGGGEPSEKVLQGLKKTAHSKIFLNKKFLNKFSENNRSECHWEGGGQGEGENARSLMHTQG